MQLKLNTMGIYTVLGLGFFGCGQEAASLKEMTSLFTDIPQITDVRVLGQEEKDIGSRICSALKDKRIFLTSFSDNQLKAFFDIKNKDCSNTISDLGTRELRYKSPLRYQDADSAISHGGLENVLTDQSYPSLTQLCDAIAANTEVRNSYDMASIKDQYEFAKTDTQFIIRINKFRLQQGAFQFYLADVASVYTADNLPQADLMGFEAERAVITNCDAAGQSNIRTQSFKNIQY